MDEATKKKVQAKAFERLIKHLGERKDVQNLDLMNLAGFCRNCLSKWYREEAIKLGVQKEKLYVTLPVRNTLEEVIATKKLLNRIFNEKKQKII